VTGAHTPDIPQAHDQGLDREISRSKALARWRRIVEFKIGVIPLPVFALLLGLLGAFVKTGTVPADIPTNAAILAIGGFACAEIGKRLPLIRHIGAAALFATFIPSYLAYAGLIPGAVVSSVSTFTRSSNFLYVFISTIIVGSILGMHRRVLISGLLKIFVPLVTGSVVAAVAGTLVGTALGLGAYHTFFFIVIPIMAGGVGEGAIPLSIGYGVLLHEEHSALIATILPPAMFGSLCAVVLSGLLNFAGKRWPHLTGQGRLQPDDAPGEALEEGSAPVAAGISDIAAAALTAMALYLVGVLAQRLWGWPAPIVMLFAVVALKLTRIASPPLERAAFKLYRFFAVAVTYPLLFAIGVSMTPWQDLVAALAPGNIVTIFVTVVTLMATGFIVAGRLRMYPIDVAIVNACHSGQGGTGDVAILTAANRLQLMPFAQIATRIGGAVTVLLALTAMSHFASPV
jgi:malate:Na+ symporter